MKYANMRYYPRNERLNLGDDIQLLAVDNIYRHAGIDLNELESVDYGDLATYDGEEVTLPISFPLLAYTSGQKITCFSERIKPIFLSVCILASQLCDDDVRYLRKFAPIGCRDLHTLNTMRKYNIPAYLNGCVTLGFPKRWAGNGKTVYLVDMPEKLKSEIPKDILERAVEVSQTCYQSELSVEPKEAAYSLYMRYIESASLVITTRMHCALPCFAAGIPTVLMKENYSYRFAGVDAVVPIYSGNHISAIDWKPDPVDLEAHKREMLDICCRRLLGDAVSSQELGRLSKRLEQHVRPSLYFEYISNTEELIRSRFSKSDELKYVLWGMTQTATIIDDFLKREFPNSRLVNVIDRRDGVEFCGTVSVHKENVSKELAESAMLLVCTASAVREANLYAAAVNWKNVYLCCNDGIVNALDVTK